MACLLPEAWRCGAGRLTHCVFLSTVLSQTHTAVWGILPILGRRKMGDVTHLSVSDFRTLTSPNSTHFGFQIESCVTELLEVQRALSLPNRFNNTFDNVQQRTSFWTDYVAVWRSVTNIEMLALSLNLHDTFIFKACFRSKRFLFRASLNQTQSFTLIKSTNFRNVGFPWQIGSSGGRVFSEESSDDITFCWL